VHPCRYIIVLYVECPSISTLTHYLVENIAHQETEQLQGAEGCFPWQKHGPAKAVQKEYSEWRSCKLSPSGPRLKTEDVNLRTAKYGKFLEVVSELWSYSIFLRLSRVVRDA
jgi:hypothetical protein